MSVTLDKEIYQWLLALDALKVSTYAKEVQPGRFELETSVTNYFSSGLIFSRLIQQISKTLPKNTAASPVNFKNLDSMKFTQTTASRIYNWNLITESLKKIDIHVDVDMKNLVINGDLDMINELLRQAYEHFHKNKGDNSMMSGSVNISQELKSTKKKTKLIEIEEAIDINTINQNKELSNTSTCLEFFVVSLAKHLSLNPKQAIALLSNNFKYLAHILAKGVKGVFEPVIYWYQEIYANTSHLVTLILKDKENNVNLVQHACKPGFLSKNIEVTTWTCRFFSKLAGEFGEKGLIQAGWEWFIGENGGLQCCLMSLKRHPDISESIISVLVQYARYNMIELFTMHLKNVCADSREHLNVMKDLFKPLTESKFTKEEISTSGIIDAWLESTIKYSESENDAEKDIRLNALSFLCEIWFAFPSRIEDQDHIAAGILNSLKRTIRDQSKSLRITAMTLLFNLLNRFMSEKDNYATVIYKTLIFSLVEHFQLVDVREFSMRNFKNLVDQNELLPLGVLLEPLFKQIQTNQNNLMFNNFDFEFFISAMKHPKFNATYGLQLFYIQADVYLNNIIYSKLAYQILNDLMTAHLNNENFQEAVIKFSKASLAMFYSSEKSKRPKEKPIPKYNNKPNGGGKTIPASEVEKEVLNSQKRALVVEILRTFINFNNSIINEKLKTYILYTFTQLKKQTKSEHKGLIMLLGLYGEPAALISQFELDQRNQNLEESIDNKLIQSLELGNASPDKGGLFKNSIDVEALNFLRDLEFGKKRKPKEGKTTKSEITEAALKKISKPDPKIVEAIESIQKEVHDKKSKKEEEEQMQREKIEKQKKALQEQLEKRKLELGVPPKFKNEEKDLIFPEGSKDSVKKNQNFDIYVTSLDNEEPKDKEVVNLLLKKNHKVVKHLFMSYCSSGNSADGKDNFSDIFKKNAVITLPELIKMLNEHDCGKILDREELKSLIRLINSELFDRKELSNLTFAGFEQFLIQYSINAFSKTSKALACSPIFMSLEEFFKVFRNATEKKGKSTILYDDPDKTEMTDKELNTLLNNRLRDNPDYILPEAYKKIEEKDYSVRFDIPQALELKPAQKVSYEIMNDILMKALGVRLLEPVVSFTTISKAKLKIFNTQNVVNWTSETHSKPLDKIKSEKQFTRDITSPEFKTEKKKQVPLAGIDRKSKLGAILKSELLKYPQSEQGDALEVAEAIEEILQTVEQGRSELIRDPKTKNKYLQEKNLKEEMDKKLKNDHDEKFKQNYQELRDMYGGDLADWRKKNREEREARRKLEEESTKAQLETIQAQKKEEQRRWAEKKKEELAAKKAEKEAQAEKEKAAEEEKKKKEAEKKKQEFEDFNQKQLEKMKAKFDGLKAQRDEEKKKIEEAPIIEKKQKIERETKILKILDKDKEKNERERKLMEKIRNAIQTEGPIKATLDKYKKQLRFVFNHYINSVHVPVGLPTAQEELLFDGFNNFATEFNIYPSIITQNETKELFKWMTIDKVPIDKAPIGISYSEFLEILLKIAILGKDKFDKLSEIKEDESGRNDDIRDENTMDDLDGATNLTVEGLMDYLDMPENKTHLIEKLIFLKENKNMPYRDKKNYWKKTLEMKQKSGQTKKTEEDEI